MSVNNERTIDRLLRTGETKAALAYLRASGTAGGMDLDTFLELVQACAKAKDTETLDAACELMRKLQIAPEDLPKVATLLANAGAHGKALECIEQIEQDRDRFGILELKARALRHLERIPEAEAVYQRMQELYPYALKSWTGAASFYRSTRNAQGEMACLVAALKLKLKDLPLIKRWAVLSAATGDRRGALAAWRQVLRIAPEDKEAAFAALELMVRLKQYGEAAQWIGMHAALLDAGEGLDKLKAAVEQGVKSSPAAAA